MRFSRVVILGVVNLSYAEALPRVQNELGFKGRVSSLKRYYQRRKHEKKLEEIAELTERGTPGARSASPSASGQYSFIIWDFGKAGGLDLIFARFKACAQQGGERQ
jgi:hypothetical protein